VGPKAGLDAVENRIIVLLPGLEPLPSSAYPVTAPTAKKTLIFSTEFISDCNTKFNQFPSVSIGDETYEY
jgi:hypothetical protein